MMSDYIKKEDAIKAVEEITWYHFTISGMAEGANEEGDFQAWYQSKDVLAVLSEIPSVKLPTRCIAELKFDTDDLKEIVDRTLKENDFEQVVRCKDCKYSQFKDNGVLRPTGYCHRLNVIISGKGKGYCYLAERKDGESDECK